MAARGRAEEVLQAAAAQELGDDGAAAGLDAGADEGDDVGVAEVGEHVQLVEDAAELGGLDEQVALEHLRRDIDLQVRRLVRYGLCVSAVGALAQLLRQEDFREVNDPIFGSSS